MMLVPIAIVLFAASGLAALFIASPRWSSAVGAGGAVAGAVAGLFAAFGCLLSGAAWRLDLAWSLPIGRLCLQMDALSAFFVAATLFLCGLAAVYARDLTRESLWEAFFARRTYATNGPRIVLDFRTASTLMGGEQQACVGSRIRFSVFTVPDGLLDRVELVRGGEAVQTVFSGRNQVPEFRAEFEHTVAPGSRPYYVRVYQTDGGAAWSSPIWVTGV